MTKAANTNFSCISCSDLYEAKELWEFDEEFQVGRCRNCILADTTIKVEMPSFRKQNMVRAMGDDAKKKEIQDQIKLYNFCNPKKTFYIEKPKKANNSPNIIAESMIHLHNKANFYLIRPSHIDYNLVKDVFWNYYRMIVKNSSGIEVKSSDMDAETIKVIQNYISWMIGSEKGDYDPQKSIYMYGDVGVGKSTIVYTGHHVLQYLGSKYKWYPRHYKHASIPTIWNESFMANKVEGLERYFKGSWCFDELSEKYLVINHYKEEYHFIRELIYARHSIWDRNKTQTIFTSNITPKRLSELFDDPAVTDRMKQQYNLIYYKGITKRKA